MDFPALKVANYVFHLYGVIPGLFPTLYAGKQTGLQQITSCAFADMTDNAELLFLDCFWVLIQQIAILGYLCHITRLLFPATDAQMPDDAERKGIGTPATRSGIIEKLVSSGFVERRKSKKITNLLPTSTGTALITVLPEQLQSPQLTAEWEHRLKEIERGEIAPDSFMDGIAAMLNELVQTYKPIPGAEVLFPSGREAVGKGIALVDTSSDQPKLRYVFDVSDTSGGENSRRPYLWEYRQEHREVVSAALEQRFDVSGENGLADQLERVAAQLVDEYWHDNRRDIVGIVDGSFLEGYDDFNIGAAFRNAAVVSTTYALLSRCGMQPGDYFEHEDFLNVFDFNTPQTVAALGTAISQSSELVLRQIEVTIKNYEREKIAERSESHEQTDLHPQRGLSDSRSEPDRAAANPAGQVRQDAEELPEGASSGAVEQPAAVREVVPSSAGDRRGSEQSAGTDDAGADEVGGRDGSAESQRPAEVGGADEHAESAGRGSDPRGAGVQLTMFDAPAGAQMSFFPSEAEQIQSIAEAESVTPSAFSMFISQDDIDHILRMGGNEEDARMRIAAEFSKQKPLEERAAFLKSLYHGGNGLITENGRFSAWYGEDGIHIAKGDTSRYLRSAQVIGWADAAERIEELLDGGAFATNLEVTEAPRNERLRVAAEVWELHHDFSDEAKSLGYLSCMGNIRSTNYPEERELLADNMRRC